MKHFRPIKDREGGEMDKDTEQSKGLIEIASTKDGKELSRITVDFKFEVMEDLRKLMLWYKTDSVSHALRMTVIDAARGLDGNGEVGSRFR